MNLQLEWVDSPRSDWIDDIESMAEGYPFEKRKKDLRDENAVVRCRQTWSNGTDDSRFLAAFFEKKLVGWIRLRESSFPQDSLDTDIVIAEWELIQRNRDDIRGRLLEEIREQYPDAIVQFSQPAQNRTGRNFYLSQPDVYGGPTDLHLGKRLDEDEPDDRAETDNKINKLDSPDVSIAELVPGEVQGFSPLRSILTENARESLFREQLKEYRARDQAGGFVRYSENGTSSVLYEAESSPPEGSTPTGRIHHVALGDDESGRTMVGRVQRVMRQSGMDYLDVRLDESQNAEYEALLELDYDALTKRMYFFRIPEDITPPVS